jgi:hypothetical protein
MSSEQTSSVAFRVPDFTDFIDPFISRTALWDTKLGKESFLYECFQCFAKLDCPGHLWFQRASKGPFVALEERTVKYYFTSVEPGGGGSL